MLAGSFAGPRPATVPTLAGGGYTGNAARIGGLDGRGGFLAMLHPRETVVDHTKGGGDTKLQVNIHGAPSEPRVENSPGRLDIYFEEAVANALTKGKPRGVLRQMYGIRGRHRAARGRCWGEKPKARASEAHPP